MDMMGSNIKRFQIQTHSPESVEGVRDQGDGKRSSNLKDYKKKKKINKIPEETLEPCD